MKQLHQLVLRCSQNRWLFLGALLGFALTLFALLQVGERFAAVTQGAEPFDLQNELTLTAIFAQLPTYTDQSRRLYLLFTLIDYLFPDKSKPITLVSTNFISEKRKVLKWKHQPEV